MTLPLHNIQTIRLLPTNVPVLRPTPSSLYIRPLADRDFHELHNTLCRGFGVNMSSESLALRLRQNGYRPEISYGAFEEGSMVGFWLSGIRAISGKRVSCCTGTTVVEEWRNRGIATAMSRSAEGAARALGAGAGVLFAQAGNCTVIRLYRNMGFEITRTLHSYSSADAVELSKDNPMQARLTDLGHAYSLRDM
ncbi:MAG: GNAT family N-acetyltransferase, partial [Candidatus Portnoybacteria bacterium]|nr:GNAT family N-acetyltransferase [Candidatus Portnoybacteria bacterium]